jgi:hypothetical protein
MAFVQQVVTPPAAATAWAGSASMAAGERRLIVRDARLVAGSQPVITFYGDPGSRSWIAESGPGYFVVELVEPAPADVSFRYLVMEGAGY